MLMKYLSLGIFIGFHHLSKYIIPFPKLCKKIDTEKCVYFSVYIFLKIYSHILCIFVVYFSVYIHRNNYTVEIYTKNTFFLNVMTNGHQIWSFVEAFTKFQTDQWNFFS